MATTARPTPTQRRYEAIHETVAQFIDERTGLLKPGTTKMGAYFQVRLLADLGRSPRWRTAVEHWGDMIMEDREPGEKSYDHLRWAIVQGAIYAGFEA